MSRAAFVTTLDSFWGAQEAGLATFYVSGPSEVNELLRRLTGEDFSVIIVTDELVADGGAEARAVLQAAPPGTDLLIVPGAGPSQGRHLKMLRERFSIALGVDVWAGTARKTGVNF